MNKKLFYQKAGYFWVLTLSFFLFPSAASAGGDDADEQAARASAPFDNSKPDGPPDAVPIGPIPGDHYEERVQEEYFGLRRQVLKNKATTLRAEAKEAAKNTGLGILATGVSAAGLSVAGAVYPTLFPIMGYVGAGIMSLLTIYGVVDTIVRWKELAPAQIARNLVSAALTSAMAVWGFLNAASFGVAFLIGIGIAGLFTTIISAVQWGARNADANEAERGAESMAGF